MDCTPAKIALPFIGTHVRRERLFALFTDAAPGTSFWLAASAGSGKTMLAASYLKSADRPFIWYQVDDRDTDPASLFHYLTLAAQVYFTSARAELPRYSMEAMHSLEAFSAQFFEQLYLALPKRFSLVFDNCQDVSGNTTLSTIFRQGLKQLPVHGQLIFISRELPPPALAGFRASGQIIVITQNQLAFNRQDITELATLSGADDALINHAEQLAQRTLGWAAGVTLMLNEPQLIDQASHPLIAQNNTLFDYFAGEFFNSCDPKLRQFLLATAHLPRISMAAARTLYPGDDAERLLNDLIRRHFFILPFDDTKTVYQYHPLFRDFLEQQCALLLTAEQITQQQIRTAELLLQEGAQHEALGLLEKARRWQDMREIIISAAPDMLASGQFLSLSQWIGRLPVEQVARDGWLGFWLGISLMPIESERSVSVLKQSFLLFSEQGDIDAMVMSWSAMADAKTISWTHFRDVDELVKLFEQHVDASSIASPDLEARLVSGMLGMFMLHGAARKDMDHWLARGHALLPSLNDLNLTTALATKLLYCHSIVTGDEECSKALIELIVSKVKADSPLFVSTRIWWQLVVAVNDWTRHDLHAMEANLRLGLHLIESNHAHFMDTLYYCFFAVRYLAANMPDESTPWLEKQRQAIKPHSEIDQCMYQAALGWQQRLLGNSSAAVSQGQAARMGAELCESGFNHLFYTALQCLNLIADKNFQSAHAMLDALDKQNRFFGSVPTANESALIRAWLAILTQDAKADEQVSTFFSRPELPGHCSASYGWTTEIAAQVCAYALSKDIESEDVQAYIQHYELSEPANITLEHWPRPCRIFTLGRFDVLIDGRSIIKRHAVSKPWQLLQLLIALGGKHVHDQKLIDTLWPDAEGDLAQSAFSTTLLRLRKSLGKDGCIVNDQGLSESQYRAGLGRCIGVAGTAEGQKFGCGAGALSRRVFATRRS